MYYNPWYNPASNNNWLSAYDALGRDFLNSEQGTRAAWAKMISESNAPRNAKGWLENNYNKYYDQYNAALGQNPSLNWTDWLGGLNFQNAYTSVSPFERGERGGNSRMKYIGW